MLRVDGYMYVLTDTEPIHLRPDLEGNRSFREQIASALECQPEHLAIQPSRPRLWDYFDLGILAHTVSIASRGVAGPSAAQPDRAFFILDMRPILCGVSWGFAPQGAVRAQELIDRFHRLCPAGRHTCISGGTPTQQNGELYHLVSRGCVIVVDFSIDDPPSSEAASVDLDSSDGEPDAYPGPPRGPPRPRPLSTTGQAQASQGRSTGDAPEDPATRPARGTSRDYHRSSAVTGKACGSVLALTALGAIFCVVCAVNWLVRCPSPAPPPELLLAITGLFWFRFRALGLALCILSCATGAGAMQLHSHCRPPAIDTPSALTYSCGGLEPDARDRRPLPTPCRAGLDRVVRRAPAHDDLITATSDLRTLLEDSVARPDSQAMFLASTLVETLCDHFTVHFEDEPSGLMPDSQTAPLSVRLQDHIPVTRQFDLTGVQLHVGCTIDHVFALLQPTAFRLWKSISPDAGVDWLWPFVSPSEDSVLPAGTETVTVYTDGSYDGTTSSWAFHAAGTRGADSYALGWIGGRVSVDPSCNNYLGATSHGALQGELTALFWCLTWLLRIPPWVYITIVSDCTAALELSSGRHGQHNGTGLQGACRAAMQALTATTKWPRISLHHQKSHVGHPGNELADGLAKFCNRHALPDPFWPTNPMQPFLREGWLPWLWLYLDSFVQPEAWPEQIGASFVDRPGPMPDLLTQAECEQMLGLRPQDDIDDGSEQISLSALFLTVNVQSLHSERATPAAEPDAQAFTGRAGLIREQLAQLGVSVAALQETRAHSNELFQSQTHLRFVSSRDSQGSYGTELWFARSHPFISHPTTPVYFEPADFLAVFWDPRTIAVRFARGAVRILFVSIHAPTSTDPLRESWWTSLCHTVERLRQNAHRSSSSGISMSTLTVHIRSAPEI